MRSSLLLARCRVEWATVDLEFKARLAFPVPGVSCPITVLPNSQKKNLVRIVVFQVFTRTALAVQSCPRRHGRLLLFPCAQTFVSNCTSRRSTEKFSKLPTLPQKSLRSIMSKSASTKCLGLADPATLSGGAAPCSAQLYPPTFPFFHDFSKLSSPCLTRSTL